MKVLSLFDGISCLRVAFDIAPDEYIASEIDTNAIKISKKNYPEIKHIGSVKDVGYIPDIDLLCGGSPCTDLSIAKKDRKGLEGDHSSLFWEWVRIWKLCKPKYFILENVNSMPKKDRDIITKELGVEPIMIDASLVSAQSRKRLFWTNIPVQGLPEDRHIFLKDILEPETEVDERMTTKGKAFTLTSTYSKVSASEAQVNNSIEKKQRTMVKHTTKKLGYVGEHDHQANRVYDETGKSPALNTLSANGLVKLGTIGNSNGQGNCVYSPEGKSVTLSANGGGGGAKTGLYDLSALNQRQKNNLRTEDEKAFCLTATNYKGSQANGTTLIEQPKTKIRKLTPIECERLQSLPDNYTQGIANTNRYKALGNAFNVEVIRFILSFIPQFASSQETKEQSNPYEV
jgi:DNA (cytosine-5)-methyltransferase 3A